MPNARLVLIGTGELVDSTRALAQELNLSDRVIFAGVRKDMAALYHAMDVFLLPSLFEGLPVVLVEAQAAGLPCFVADTVDPARRLPATSTTCPCRMKPPGLIPLPRRT